MHIFSLRTKVINREDDVLTVLALALSRLRPRRGDIVAVTSKILSVAEGRVVKLNSIHPTPPAVRLSRRFSVSPAFAQLILTEADDILGGTTGAILTSVHGAFIANAGIDLSNAPPGSALLFPSSPARWAHRISTFLSKRFRVHLGVIITDSFCIPSRAGTLGVALAIDGFRGVRDERGKPDLYGRRMRLTTVNIADTLATAANFMMGERQEQTPAALIRGAQVQKSSLSSQKLTQELRITRKRDLFSKIYH